MGSVGTENLKVSHFSSLIKHQKVKIGKSPRVTPYRDTLLLLYSSIA